MNSTLGTRHTVVTVECRGGNGEVGDEPTQHHMLNTVAFVVAIIMFLALDVFCQRCARWQSHILLLQNTN